MRLPLPRLWARAPTRLPLAESATAEIIDIAPHIEAARAAPALPAGGEPMPAPWRIEQKPDGSFHGVLALPDVPDVAASRFSVWLRTTCASCELTSRRLWSLYLEHCEIDGLTPLPDNTLLAALAHQSGIARRQAKGLVRNGRRYRPTVWRIETDDQQQAAA